jgi:exopolyphosphatase/guanosine-5'-triphosphate,3'-diphosphate pyrophosphatase
MPQPRHTHFQTLDQDSRRTVLLLAPLLRIADALDRGHEQRVRDLTTATKNGNISVVVQADADADLELWAANKAADAFLEIYAQPVSLQKARAQRRP